MKQFNCFIVLLTSARADHIVFNLLKENIAIKLIGKPFSSEKENTIGACLAFKLSFYDNHEWVKNNTISVRDELSELIDRLNIKTFSIIVAHSPADVSWRDSNVKREEKSIGSPYRDKAAS